MFAPEIEEPVREAQNGADNPIEPTPHTEGVSAAWQQIIDVTDASARAAVEQVLKGLDELITLQHHMAAINSATQANLGVDPNTMQEIRERIGKIRPVVPTAAPQRRGRPKGSSVSPDAKDRYQLVDTANMRPVKLYNPETGQNEECRFDICSKALRGQRYEPLRERLGRLALVDLSEEVPEGGRPTLHHKGRMELIAAGPGRGRRGANEPTDGDV
jgi:hypothetical protein